MRNSTLLAYFEVRINKVERDAGVALGFVAPPYPTWRLPGWERASLGVHGDDGRRYVNDSYGGRDFTDAFKLGDTLGLGMEFAPAAAPSHARMEKGKGPGMAGTTQKKVASVFFTRNGQKEGGWDVNEEVDEEIDQPGGVTGLEGDRDLHAAVGVFGGSDFTVVFGRHNWMWRPEKEP